jgi:galacturonosyltransferase
MKFLIATNHSYMLWQFRRELIAALQERGEVVLCMPFVGHEKDFMAMGCHCIDTPFERRGVNPITDAKLLTTYRRILRVEKPDMVITYSIKPNVYMGYLCGQMGVPYCINVQGLGTAFQKEPIATLVTKMYTVSCRKAKAVFFENKSNAQEFVKRKILPADKPIVLQGAGVNIESYALQPYPSEEKGIRFLYLGRIMREKGIDECFAAAEAIKKDYEDRVQFELVGFFEEAYREKVDQLVADGVVTFHGFQADPRPYYAASHCVVLPSYHEGMSNVLLEAAATGRALITTDIPGCREAVEDGVTGYLCRKRDAASLRESLDRFIRLSEDERREMGLRGRRKMEAEFEKQMVVSQTMDAILGE